MRAALRASTRGASSWVIQRTSAAATKCRVPRMGQVRTMARRDSAASTMASVAPRMRWPSAHSDPR